AGGLEHRGTGRASCRDEDKDPCRDGGAEPADSGAAFTPEISGIVSGGGRLSPRADESRTRLRQRSGSPHQPGRLGPGRDVARDAGALRTHLRAGAQGGGTGQAARVTSWSSPRTRGPIRRSRDETTDWDVTDTGRKQHKQGLWVPAFAGTTARVVGCELQ